MNTHVVESLVILLIFIGPSGALYCYNCSSTQREWTMCGGDFGPSIFPFNHTKKHLVNCSEENAMCFVRSWSMRARHAWIVQRGCYQSTADDTLPTSMTIPTRAMSCKHERHPDAEYKVCLCQADWCNSASTITPSLYGFNKNIRNLNIYVLLFLYLCVTYVQ